MPWDMRKHRPKFRMVLQTGQHTAWQRIGKPEAGARRGPSGTAQVNLMFKAQTPTRWKYFGDVTLLVLLVCVPCIIAEKSAVHESDEAREPFPAALAQTAAVSPTAPSNIDINVVQVSTPTPVPSTDGAFIDVGVLTIPTMPKPPTVPSGGKPKMEASRKVEQKPLTPTEISTAIPPPAAPDRRVSRNQPEIPLAALLQPPPVPVKDDPPKPATTHPSKPTTFQALAPFRLTPGQEESRRFPFPFGLPIWVLSADQALDSSSKTPSLPARRQPPAAPATQLLVEPPIFLPPLTLMSNRATKPPAQASAQVEQKVKTPSSKSSPPVTVAEKSQIPSELLPPGVPLPPIGSVPTTPAALTIR